MPVVVLGGAAALLAEIALDVAVLGGILLMTAFTVWMLNNAKAVAGGIPFVGTPVTRLVIGLQDAVQRLAQSANQLLNDTIFNLARRVGQFLQWVTIGVWQQINTQWSILHGGIDYVLGFARTVNYYVMVVAIPQINELRSLTWANGSAIAAVTGLARATDGLVRASVVPLLDALRLAQGATQARTSIVEQWRARTADPTLTALIPFLPLLRELEGFEGGALRRIAALEAELTTQRGRVQALEGALATVLPLAVIAVLGAEVISNLRCVAHMPCDPLNALLASDLDARVTELELGA